MQAAIRIPRLYAAASLKLLFGEARAAGGEGIPRLYAAASLKPLPACLRPRGSHRIPRLYAAASLKLPRDVQRPDLRPTCIPRLYAAASLKLLVPRRGRRAAVEVFRGSMPRPH